MRTPRLVRLAALLCFTLVATTLLQIYGVGSLDKHAVDGEHALVTKVDGEHAVGTKAGKGAAAASSRRKATTVLYSSSCECDLLQLDCIPSVQCFGEGYFDNDSARIRVSRGAALRHALRAAVQWSGEVDEFDRLPPGKALLYTATDGWKRWIFDGQMPAYFPPRDDYINVVVRHAMLHQPNSDCLQSRYAYCHKHRLRGKNCLFDHPNEPERRIEPNTDIKLDNTNVGQQVSAVKKFIKRVQRGVARTNDDPWLYLLTISYALKAFFQPSVQLEQIYTKHLTRIRRVSTSQTPPLRVALHVRRADSCYVSGYSNSASPINASAQHFNARVCYAVSVYCSALTR